MAKLFQCRAQALWGWQGQFNFAMHSTALIYELMHFLSQERGLLLLDGMQLQREPGGSPWCRCAM